MSEAQSLTGGSFYGAVQRQQHLHDAIFSEIRHTCSKKLPAHSHALPFFGLLLSGHYGERYRHREKQFGPFSIMYRPAGIPHQDEVAPGGLRFFEIEILPGWRQRLAYCSANLDAPREDCHGGHIFWLAMDLYRETHLSNVAADLCIESLLAELLGAVALKSETAKRPPRWLRVVTDKLQSEYSDRLTLAALSTEAGVHPVHLSRVFRRFTGQGIGEYVHRLRVRAACERMLVRDRELAEIGIAVGFADQSHFTRVFRKIAGMSPATFRKLVCDEPATGEAYAPVPKPALAYRLLNGV